MPKKIVKEKTCFGFGVEPSSSETANHFYVVIFSRVAKKTYVEIYERFKWFGENPEDVPEDAGKDNQLKMRISKKKWDAVVKDMTAEFNTRLRAEKKPVGKFVTGGTPVERMFGKEMMVLLWAIEDCDLSCIPTAVARWKGLRPEERWWLYMMTNADSAGSDDNSHGWRAALRFAICDKPIIDEKTLKGEMRL